MAEGKVPEGLRVAVKKHRYPLSGWKVTRDRPSMVSRHGYAFDTEPQRNQRIRRVVFKGVGKNSSARLELRGPPEELAKMFAEIAAALWGLDGSDKGAEPEDSNRTYYAMEKS